MALSRLSTSHLIARRRQGRTTNYRLTEHSRRMLGEGRDRIFSFGQQTSWDGTWTLLMHTIPEQKRALRHDLRSASGSSASPLHAATWVAPRDRTSDVHGLLDELTGEEHADVFVGLPRPAPAASS
jgi:phenylacetic acid degradation operon negative regulatory protein